MGGYHRGAARSRARGFTGRLPNEGRWMHDALTSSHAGQHADTHSVLRMRLKNCNNRRTSSNYRRSSKHAQDEYRQQLSDRCVAREGGQKLRQSLKGSLRNKTPFRAEVFFSLPTTGIGVPARARCSCQTDIHKDSSATASSGDIGGHMVTHSAALAVSQPPVLQ